MAGVIAHRRVYLIQSLGRRLGYEALQVGALSSIKRLESIVGPKRLRRYSSSDESLHRPYGVGNNSHPMLAQVDHIEAPTEIITECRS